MNTIASFLSENRQRIDPAAYRLDRGYSSLLITPRFRASSHVIFMLIPRGTSEPTLVAKVPRLRDARASLTREANALSSVQKLHGGRLASIPQLVAFEEYHGSLLLIETALNGVLMDNATLRRNFDACCAMTLRWLRALQPQERAAASAGWYETLVEAPFAYFASVLTLSREESDLLDQTRALVAPLKRMNLPFVIEHGDLSHPNLIVSAQGELGVVDWELATTEGLVGTDLFFFLAYAAFARAGANTNDEYIAAFHSAFFASDGWARSYITAYLEDFGIPREAFKPLFVLSWARYLIQLLGRLELPNTEQASVEAATAEWLRTNRFFALWRYAVTHADLLENNG